MRERKIALSKRFFGFIIVVLQILKIFVPEKPKLHKNGSNDAKFLPDFAGYICSYRNGSGPKRGGLQSSRRG